MTCSTLKTCTEINKSNGIKTKYWIENKTDYTPTDSEALATYNIHMSKQFMTYKFVKLINRSANLLVVKSRLFCNLKYCMSIKLKILEKQHF